MIGTTLAAISDHIEALSSETGEYSLVCARYGDRPVPAAGLRFESRAAARAAARATEQYRDALRRYDPQVPYYDVIVRQEYAGDEGVDRGVCDGSADGDAGSGRSAGDAHDVRRFSATEAADWSLSDPAVGHDPGPNPDSSRDPEPNPAPSRDLVGFCHDAAAAVFEALSAGDHDAVESAVMDAYFAFAEERSDPDGLCLRLLEAMAFELRRGLEPTEQAAVLADAASRLPVAPDADPVAGAFERLAGAGVVGSYAADSGGDEPPAESVVVHVSDYALTPRDGRFPTLPVALELCRHGDRSPPRAVRVDAVEGGWRLGIDTASGDEPSGLTSAPIRE
ncbi:hypothetical protein [Halorubrum sp. Eb13]|uniref:DUF7551 domain-containing protein n=1 Tax=Halorubrum sp. Eb13 TaxID=1383843 RepID=UPI000B98403D|nr:hypothetical protein [Halorubrum sp. Eb13]OYR46051.1 hypothetical protein DJ75_06680 [Halorubrum sp. Eb13]